MIIMARLSRKILLLNLILAIQLSSALNNISENFCLSTHILLGNFNAPSLLLPNVPQVEIVFRIASNQNYFLNSNSTTKLPFVSKRAPGHCYIFNIYIPNQIKNIYSNENKAAIALIRIIRNSSFAFHEDNVHFLIHLVHTSEIESYSEDDNHFLSLFSGEGIYSLNLENGDKKSEGEWDEYVENELSISAKITFVIQTDAGAMILKPYCYQCPEGTKLNRFLNISQTPYFDFKGPFQLFNRLSVLHNSLQIDEEKMAYIYSKTGGEVDRINNENCTRQSLQYAGTISCFSSHILLNMTATKMNMTLAAMGDLERPDKAGLYFCLLCSPRGYYADIIHPPPLLHYDNFKKFNVIYCHYRHDFSKPAFLMLCKPFDRYIWFLMIITCLVVGAVTRDSGFGLDVFYTIINQQVQRRWTFGMTTIFLVLIVLTNAYLGVVTRDLTKPLQERRIETIEELVKGGKYKLLVENPAMAETLRKQYIEPTKPKLNFTSQSYLVVPGLNLERLLDNYFETLHVLAKYQGAFGIPDMMGLKPLMRNGFRLQTGNASCSTVIETLPTQMHWILRLNYAGKAYSILQTLQRAGIGEFFESMQKSMHFARTLMTTVDSKTRQRMFEDNRPESLVLESSPKIVFFYYSLLNIVALLSLSTELWWWNKKNRRDTETTTVLGDPVPTLVQTAEIVAESTIDEDGDRHNRLSFGSVVYSVAFWSKPKPSSPKKEII